MRDASKYNFFLNNLIFLKTILTVSNINFLVHIAIDLSVLNQIIWHLSGIE